MSSKAFIIGIAVVLFAGATYKGVSPSTRIIIVKDSGEELVALDWSSGKLDVQCEEDKCTQAARVFFDHVAELANAHCAWPEVQQVEARQ